MNWKYLGLFQGSERRESRIHICELWKAYGLVLSVHSILWALSLTLSTQSNFPHTILTFPTCHVITHRNVSPWGIIPESCWAFLSQMHLIHRRKTKKLLVFYRPGESSRARNAISLSLWITLDLYIWIKLEGDSWWGLESIKKLVLSYLLSLF